MKKEKKSQASIISIVLIILLVIASMIIVWNVVKPMITNTTKQSDTSPMTNRFEIKNVILYNNGNVTVFVKRLTGNAELKSLKFIFYDKNNENTIITVKDNLPKELEEKSYSFLGSSIKRKTELVSITPEFKNVKGYEIFENKESIKRNSTGDRVRY